MSGLLLLTAVFFFRLEFLSFPLLDDDVAAESGEAVCLAEDSLDDGEADDEEEECVDEEAADDDDVDEDAVDETTARRRDNDDDSLELDSTTPNAEMFSTWSCSRAFETLPNEACSSLSKPPAPNCKVSV